jgi:hypothetical protein
MTQRNWDLEGYPEINEEEIADTIMDGVEAFLEDDAEFDPKPLAATIAAEIREGWAS